MPRVVAEMFLRSMSFMALLASRKEDGKRQNYFTKGNGKLSGKLIK